MLCLSRLEETVNDADFIFEAVKEDLEIKKDLLESKCGIPKKEASILFMSGKLLAFVWLNPRLENDHLEILIFIPLYV